MTKAAPALKRLKNSQPSNPSMNASKAAELYLKSKSPTAL
jgi:hypothetical protein